MKDFAGKTAFITGGAGGIGFAMARAFGRRGMKVAIADVEADTCAKAVETLRAEGITAIGIPCDVADREQYAQAAERTFAEFGEVHVLCNNAGVSRAGPIETIASSDWDWVIGVNLKGLVHGLQLFLPQMRAHGEDSHIVNTASVNGVVGSALAGPYSATKFAVVGISRGAGGGTKGHADRRQRALPELGQDPDARQRPQPPDALWRSDQDRGRCRQCRAQCTLRQGAGDRARSG